MPESLAEVIMERCNIHKLDAQGQTPLHIATIVQDYKFAMMLIERGVDPHIRDNSGKTALDKHLDQMHQVHDKYPGFPNRQLLSAVLCHSNLDHMVTAVCWTLAHRYLGCYKSSVSDLAFWIRHCSLPDDDDIAGSKRKKSQLQIVEEDDEFKAFYLSSDHRVKAPISLGCGAAILKFLQRYGYDISKLYNELLNENAGQDNEHLQTVREMFDLDSKVIPSVGDLACRRIQAALTDKSEEAINSLPLPSVLKAQVMGESLAEELIDLRIDCTFHPKELQNN